MLNDRGLGEAKSWVICFLAVLLAMIVGISLYVDRPPKGAEVPSGVPKLEVSLNDVDLEEINSNGAQEKYGGNNLTLTIGGSTKHYKNVEIKGHGNHSWRMDKKSYRIKFNEKEDFLGMGKAKKWVLISGSLDDSLLRNDLGFLLNRLIVDKSPMKGEFVWLIVDGQELGLYYVTKTIDIDKNMFWLKEPDGIIVEYDNAYGKDEEIKYETKDGGLLVVKDVVDEDNLESILEDFGKQFDEFEVAAKKHDYDTIQDIVDVDSFAEYFILSEISGNPDAFITSLYFYRDGANDKIHAGIGWDFDGAFGNKNWGEWGPDILMGRREFAFEEGALISRFFYYLVEIPEFYDLICDIYKEKLMHKYDEILDYIDMRAKMIEKEAILDNNMWEKRDFWDEVGYLKWWIEERLRLYDDVYGDGVVLPVNVNEM